MTEHVLNFAIELEDDAIREMVYKNAVKSINKDIKIDILSAIFERQHYYGSSSAVKYDHKTDSVVLDNDASLKEFVIGLIKETFEEHSDEIIKMAAEILADSFKRTKKWKEVACGAIEEVSK